ncbi:MULTISPECIES: lytic transglycosylase domain-containing protein [unclassified Rhizobium]|uniref:lytic transglycosylase domain-containing protein n=1 Tax=unclassified Rhizobium TaxID=2613769 RepID=UPI001ADC716C|nr:MULTISPECIES: lytic transglycosylase domain-containing protein [unclassified Rhizobium]MBO9098900.1 transglycosylase SLT domain-containing protein [Rhizobium sp. L58/93]MBO9185115.1 transglycosylase SLT domain-containing protein [Rhizobium sp. E27B/91]QXZ85262.1 transglycosylase SLT domain-containing protein [Rhizobium sp. K1/93]QXZ90599.1 transglycosylase SLT domain-containing protein [Rhizobium sp. K15/93]QYA03138.1 transglycosylase SLT domain-containing protein [Rhizobium sp. B21/90]
MIASGFTSLKRSVAVSAILCGGLAGCATQQQTSQADLSHTTTNVPHPTSTAQVSTTAAPGSTTAIVSQAQPQATATLSKSGRLPGTETAAAIGPRLPADQASNMQDRMGQPAGKSGKGSEAQVAIASVTGAPAANTSASAAYASSDDMLIPSVVAIPTPNPSRPGDLTQTPALSSALVESGNAIPMTPEMVAIQAVVPTPRPGEASPFTATQVAYAAPSQAANLSYADNRLHYDFNFDTTGPSIVPAVLEERSDDNVSSEEKGHITTLIEKYAKLYQVPAALIHRVVHRESRYDPKAFNNRGYFGLMQIKYNTAKSMGYDGPASGLFDAETNIKYAAKYLRGAWMVADNKLDTAVALYARGYYYDAKNKGMTNVANGNY